MYILRGETRGIIEIHNSSLFFMINKQNFRTIPSTDLKGHRKYFGKFGHVCQLIRNFVIKGKLATIT